MRARKNKRIIEKIDAISQLVPYVCDQIRKLGEGAETCIRDHVDQFYDDAGYELKPLGSDIGWAWTKDNGVTYVLKDDDQFEVLDLVIKELEPEFKLDFSKYAGMIVGTPYNVPFVIRKAKDHGVW